MTPERRPDTSGGDSRYASGSQPWNGQNGALTAKAIAKPRNSQSLVLGAIVSRSNEFC